MKEIQMIKKTDPDFPKCFDLLSKKPTLLYYIGNLNLLNEKCVAIIGKRDAEVVSLNRAKSYGKYLSEKGYVVVNGIARGIDQSAIQGVIEAKGKAILVMPCGLDCIYPSSAKPLVDVVLKLGGCVISEYLIGTKPQKSNFLQRDRLQAAISNKILVISADKNGGTMATVKCALGLNKPVACIIESNGDTPFSGNKQIIESKKGVGIQDEESALDFIQEPISVQMSLTFS